MSFTSMVDGVPQGLGVYVGRGGVSSARARQLHRAGVRHLTLCLEADDGWAAPPTSLATWGQVCRDEGLVAHGFAFPGLPSARQPKAVAATLLGGLRRLGGVCPVPDLEAAYRGRPELLTALLDELVRLATPAELEALLVTTFGLPSDRGTRWPWSPLHKQLRELRARTGRRICSIGWQCYERAAELHRVRAGIAELAAVWGEDRTIPHLATYARKAETAEGPDGGRRLEADLERACLDEDGRCDVPGVWLWSAASLAADELAILRDWTTRVGWQ